MRLMVASSPLMMTTSPSENMDMNEEMTASAVNSIGGYIKAIRDKTGEVETVMYDLAVAGHNAFKRGQGECSLARVYYRSGENAIEGDILGAKSKEEKLKRVYEEIAINKAKSYEIEMHPGIYRVPSRR